MLLGLCNCMASGPSASPLARPKKILGRVPAVLHTVPKDLAVCRSSGSMPLFQSGAGGLTTPGWEAWNICHVYDSLYECERADWHLTFPALKIFVHPLSEGQRWHFWSDFIVSGKCAYKILFIPVGDRFPWYILIHWSPNIFLSFASSSVISIMERLGAVVTIRAG